MILVDALFINKGGGAVLLQYLIETILRHPRKDDFFFLLDPRFEKPGGLERNFTVIPNKIKDRVRFYKQHKSEYAKVFCFANTPPPVRLKVPVYTYFHNQKLLEAPKQKFKSDYRKIYLKYLYLKLNNRNTDYYIVQTPHIVTGLVASGLKDSAHCLSIPFYDNKKYVGGHKPFAERRNDEFAFVSNPSPQKNYPTLLDAWEYLLEQGHTPVLHVTVDETGPQFIARIAALNARGAKIVNHTYIDPRELYFTCPYLIFPSIMESFGLPLIEAVDSGMKVLASDLPYVYDVIKPSLTFAPYDKKSIADAVVKAMTTDLPMPVVLTKNEVDKLVSLLAE
jgi:glycosyltransferase involved in cell wall biosynthesis